MKLVLQRVKKSAVHVDEQLVSEIGHGLMILFGVEKVIQKKWLIGLLKRF